MVSAYEYLTKNLVMSDKDYVYEAVDSICRYDETKGLFKLSGSVEVPQKSTNSLYEALTKGPVSVAI